MCGVCAACVVMWAVADPHSVQGCMTGEDCEGGVGRKWGGGGVGGGFTSLRFLQSLLQYLNAECACVCMCACVRACVRVYVCVRACVCMCACVCMYVCASIVRLHFIEISTEPAAVLEC